MSLQVAEAVNVNATGLECSLATYTNYLVIAAITPTLYSFLLA